MTYEFKGWAGYDKEAATGGLKYEAFEPKVFEDDDVDVKILYCGICGSDASVLAGEFGPIEAGRIAGHEIVGEVVRVGPKAEGLKLGDVVGIGAQSDSCLACEFCTGHKEQYCATPTFTFGSPYARGASAGQNSKGGFASHWRGPAHFAIPLPSGLDPAAAAPLLCGGVTVYTPLKRWGAGSERKRVGVLGLGGLGHMAVLIARAMGAEVTAISRGTSKEGDARKLGAGSYIATGADLAQDLAPHARTLDLVISTINPPKVDVAAYLGLLRPEGAFVTVGAVIEPFSFHSFPLITGGLSVGGSNTGSPDDIRELLALVAAHPEALPWVQKWDMGQINEAMVEFGKGAPRYRFVLANTGNGARL
ncbi:hypothetical protein Q8F55_005402 [Vanrija albida]|uniref:Enoyl reductase (ER) domain-containing protein n=1 Tax=Vanrija albida TaxID=181172 RepID=A0ABR3Q1J9_9TREE